MSKFNIGDQVRVTQALHDRYPESDLPVGAVGTVISIEDEHNLTILTPDYNPEELLDPGAYAAAAVMATWLQVDPHGWPMLDDEIERV